MKLYIQEKVFSWGDKFTVKDECGNDKYIVEGDVFTWGKKLHVYDMAGNDFSQAVVKSRLLTVLFNAPVTIESHYARK